MWYADDFRLKSPVKLVRTTSSSSVTLPRTLKIFAMHTTTALTLSIPTSALSSKPSRRTPSATPTHLVLSSEPSKSTVTTTSSLTISTATTRPKLSLTRPTRTRMSGSPSALLALLAWASSAVIVVSTSMLRVSGISNL